MVVSNDVEKGDDVGPASKVLQDFDLTLDFLLFHRLQNLDDAFLVVNHVDALKHFGVFSTA